MDGRQRRAYKKKLSTEKICLYKTTTSPNERKATRTPCRHLPEDDTDTTPPYYHINLLAPYFILPFIYCDGRETRPPSGHRRQAQRSCAPRVGAPGGRQSFETFHGPSPPRERRPPCRRQLATCLHHLLHTRRRHGKDANTLAVCNIGLHGRAEMSAPLI